MNKKVLIKNISTEKCITQIPDEELETIYGGETVGAGMILKSGALIGGLLTHFIVTPLNVEAGEYSEALTVSVLDKCSKVLDVLKFPQSFQNVFLFLGFPVGVAMLPCFLTEFAGRAILRTFGWRRD